MLYARTRFATFCTELHFALQSLHSHIFREYGKMRQISASNRSQNVVKIAITDYCDFGAGLLILLSFQTIISIPNPIRKLFNRRFHWILPATEGTALHWMLPATEGTALHWMLPAKGTLSPLDSPANRVLLAPIGNPEPKELPSLWNPRCVLK